MHSSALRNHVAPVILFTVAVITACGATPKLPQPAPAATGAGSALATGASPCTIDQAPAVNADDIVSRLGQSPTEADVDALATAISSGAAVGDIAAAESKLRTLLGVPASRMWVLSAMGKHALPQLELDALASAPKPSDQPSTDFDQFLSAIVRSGGSSSLNWLAPLAFGPPSTLVSSPAIRAKLWGAAISIAPTVGAYRAFEYYGTFGAPNLTQDAASVLVRRISAAKTREDLARLLPSFQAFLGTRARVFGPGPAPVVQIPVGAADSPRRVVVVAIKNALVSLDSPPADAVLARFLSSDQPDFSKSLSLSLASLDRAPWLLPTWWLGLAPNQRSATEKTALHDHTIQAPSDLPFIEAQKRMGLRRYAAASGTTAKPQATDITDAQAIDHQRALLSAMLAQIKKDYGIAATPVPLDAAALMAPNPAGVNAARSVEVAIGAAAASVFTSLSSISDNRARQTTATYVAQREAARRALVLYALATAYRRLERAPTPPALETADDDLEKVSDLLPPTDTLIASQAVSSLDLSPERSPACTLRLPPSCQATEFALKARTYSFSQGLYEETLQVRCAGSSTPTTLQWVDGIPLPLMTALREHPRLLDYPGVSLAARTLAIEGHASETVADELDMVTGAPNISLPYLLAAASRPQLPWHYTHDGLVSDTDWATAQASVATPPATFPVAELPLPDLPGVPIIGTPWLPVPAQPIGTFIGSSGTLDPTAFEAVRTALLTLKAPLVFHRTPKASRKTACSRTMRSKAFISLRSQSSRIVGMA
jgi:hypothetical protein